MSGEHRGSRALVIIGVVAMIVGALDPLEGSVVILGGSACAALGARLSHRRHTPLFLWSFVLVALGVGSLWGWSTVGGLGGRTGRSMWWALTLAPYPVGWVMGLIAGYRQLRNVTPTTPR